MSLQQKIVDIYSRIGAPTRWVVKTALSYYWPEPENRPVIEQIDSVLGCAHEYAKDCYQVNADQLARETSSADLKRVKEILDVLAGDVQSVLVEVAKVQGNEKKAGEILKLAQQNNAQCQVGFAKLNDLAQRTHDKVQATYELVLRLLAPQENTATPSANHSVESLVIEPGKYDARINQKNPSCLLLLVDQSKSMDYPFGRQRELLKADGVAVMINSVLDDLCLLCGKSPRLYIGVIGYGEVVRPILEGPLANRSLVTTGELEANPLQTLSVSMVRTHPNGKTVENRKLARIWIKSSAGGENTRMKEAFELAHTIVTDFLTKHPNCFPPIVLNFTDGEPTSGDPSQAAAALRQQASTNGNVLLFNAHLSDESYQPVLFPKQESDFPAEDKFARQMFQMSSVLPDLLVLRAWQKKSQVNKGGRCFAFNGDLNAVATVLSVGMTYDDPPIAMRLKPVVRPS